ncbi:MAG TPA: hypothetical protein VEA44_16885 [Caulobacter sp.]|nr:hypothetical protein [Caulobacter sp.]
MSRLIAVVALTVPALLLGSCMHGRQAMSAGMDWSLHQTPEEGVKLAYGAPASDNVVLMLTCQPGAGQVRLSTVAAKPQSAIVLKSGSDRSSLTATAMPGGPVEGHYMEANAAATDKTLARFARTGDLTLVQGKASIELPAKGAAREQVSRFFTACAA